MTQESLNSSQKFFIFCMIGFAILFYLCTGTLAPYGASLEEPLILKPCRYLANIDHEEFAATFRFIRWESRGWQYSVMLRRLLYPVLAWPGMTLFGFMLGGLLSTFFIYLYTFKNFFLFLKQSENECVARIALLILCTYPGIFYWTGLPYSFVMIVPCIIGIYMYLHKFIASPVRQNHFTTVSWKDYFILGILLTGYDLMPITLACGLWILFYKRAWSEFHRFLLGTLLPSILILMLLKARGQHVINSNSVSYFHIINSYLNKITNWPEYRNLLMQIPEIFTGVFFYSNFVYLSLFALLFFLLGIFQKKSFLTHIDHLWLTVIFLIFLFNHLAPPYPGWQMRGLWIARIYQPTFIIFVLLISRMASKIYWTRRLLFALLILQVSVPIAPYLGYAAYTSVIYHKFYRHGPSDAFEKNIHIYGHRPLGFCSKESL